MNSEKLGFTLFDILGYLLPGYVLVFCFSLIEATFFASSLFGWDAIGSNLFFYTVVSYFAGHLCHIVSSVIKGRFFLHLGEKDRLNSPVYGKFRKMILNTYNFGPKEAAKLSSLDLYMLADSFIVVAGASDERSSLQVREGFYKSASAAFGFLSLVIFGSLFADGLKVQFESGVIQSFNLPMSLVLFILSLIVFLLFANRFSFYNRMKLSNTYSLFLACVSKNGGKSK